MFCQADRPVQLEPLAWRSAAGAAWRRRWTSSSRSRACRPISASFAPSWPIRPSAPAMRAPPSWLKIPNSTAAGDVAATPASALALFEQQAAGLERWPPGQAIGVNRADPGLPRCSSPSGEEGVENACTPGAVIEIQRRTPASSSPPASTLMVVSAAPRWRPAVTAPCAGLWSRAIEPAEVGASVAAGQIVATIAPSDGGPVRPRDYGEGSGRHWPRGAGACRRTSPTIASRPARPIPSVARCASAIAAG